MNVEHCGSLIVIKWGGTLRTALGTAYPPARETPRDLAHCLSRLGTRQRVLARKLQTGQK